MDLFEAAEARKRREASQAGEGGRDVLTVSALTAMIKQTLEERFPRVSVVGQISNLTAARSGHVYLTLKDENAEIGAVIWRSTASRIRFELEDGQEVVVRGRLAVYEKRGRYQIIVSKVEPKGVGALQLAFLQLRDKLKKEGLFNPAHKKPLPFMPETIALVTSPTGAAVHDMLSMILSRFPPAHVVICPVAVQGDEAAPQIAAAIGELNERGGIDVMVVGRGGGSLEDLWPFNEEVVARAIFESRVPVVSAVGHEVDVSISDLVADARALTPTKAGELVVPSVEQLGERLDAAAGRLGRALVTAARHTRARLDAAARSYGMRLPLERVRQHQQQLDELTGHMQRTWAHLSERIRTRLDHLESALQSLSPYGVLARGYSITMQAGSSKPMRSKDAVQPGAKIRTVLHHGELDSIVESTRDGAERGA
ncbi:MAG: exodeoxyribonuclease VII large subunit [Planctomycetota bacterium]